MTESDLSRMLTLEDAADFIMLSTRTLRRKIQAGELAAHKFGRLWRISEADLMTYIAQHRRGGEDMPANILI